MTKLENHIKTKLERNLQGKFEVVVDDEVVLISSATYSANTIWDMIEISNLFGSESNGWMTAIPQKGVVVLQLRKMVI